MARRTLKASQPGIEKAKRALKRLGLVQKDLTIDPLIASWGTINNFFNGRAIDHTIFKEICFHLNLDWQEIYEPPEDDTPPQTAEPKSQTTSDSTQTAEDPILLAVQRQSIAAREALTPRILERIPREVVRKKYLPAIDRGVNGGQQRIIPIIGAAGYGKSTILGNLYDELIQAKTPWVGLILCNALSMSAAVRSFISYSMVASTLVGVTDYNPASPSSYQASMVENGFGQSLCGTSRSILEVTRHLNHTYGQGVLLIDTLDLVISRDFIPAFVPILRQLLEQGTTIVFTCRDHEYNDYLEPTRERLPGIPQTIDRHTVPNFTTSEIRAAAETFFQKIDPKRGQTFADNILSLSADNRSLRDIIENPLLLALLCDLFAQEGNVPPDLTVSKLYKRYWSEKIAYSRADQSHFKPLAIEKENLCLTITRVLFEMSQTQLCESIYRDEIGVQFTELTTQAYADLFSEGVLESLPSSKIHFFHQTLLEYAIAYWLTRHTAQPQRNQWLETLRNPASQSINHWYPVLRQYLTIVETDHEFEQLAEQLGTNHLGIFSAIVFAAASRDRPDALLKLLPTALKSGESYQKRLQQALESAPRQFAEEVWSMMVMLLSQGSHAIAINTARTMNALAIRWWDQLSSRLADAIAAVAERSSTQDQSMILGWLVQDSLSLLQERSNPILLASLRQFYPRFGARSCVKIVQLHLTSPVEVQEELLLRMLEQAIPDNVELEEITAQFLAAFMEAGLQKLWSSWLEALHQVNPSGWDVIQARAIGLCAVKNPEIITLVLQDLLESNPPEPRRNSIVLSEALRQGAETEVAEKLIQCPFEQLEPQYFSTVTSFLRIQGHLFSSEHQEAIAQKLKPFIAQYAERLRPAFDTLADQSMTARELFRQLVSELSPKKQAEYEGRLLRFIPISEHPPLETLDKESQLFLLKLYRTEVSPKAVEQILQATHSKYKEVAIAASQELYSLMGDQLSLAFVIGLLRSRFPGVRVNGLTAIAQMTDRGKTLQTTELTEIAIALKNEDNQAIVCLWCEIAANWIQTYRQIPPNVADAIGNSLLRLVKKQLLDGGSCRNLLAALKAIAQSVGGESTVEIPMLKDWVILLLTSIDLIRVINSEPEVIDLLCAIHRLDQTFIVRLVEQECLIFSQRGWWKNIAPILKAVRRIDQVRSPLFDRVLSSDWCTPEIEGMILEIRGI